MMDKWNFFLKCEHGFGDHLNHIVSIKIQVPHGKKSKKQAIRSMRKIIKELPSNFSVKKVKNYSLIKFY